jgi:SARP family transcriptional regulator, regulator of embCAB operon
LQSETTRIQLCGKLVVELQGRRLEQELPGRQGRVLFGYLAVNRRRGVDRDELIEALWPERAPAGAEANLRSLVSRLRRVLGPALKGRGTLQLVLPRQAWIDLEAADAAIHRAESAVERAAWHEAWAPSHIALNVTRRTFLPGVNAAWTEELRRHLDHIRLRALECWIQVALGIGGGELADAEAAARKLTREAPLHESGYLLLMRVLDARGNAPEATQTYEQLRVRLRDGLGITPGPATRELHARILLRENTRPKQAPRSQNYIAPR